MRRSERYGGHPKQSQQMTLEDIELTIHFLKQRFSQYSIEDIIFSLVQQVQNDQAYHRSEGYVEDQLADNQRNFEEGDVYEHRYQRPRRRFTRNLAQPRQLREHVPSLAADHEERLYKFEEIKLIAACFCEVGDNFNLMKKFLPNLTPQQYASHLNHINGQAVNEVQNFLRYQCNIQMQYIDYDQKRSLVLKLKKVRDWLGKKSVALLGTYFKFIERHFQNKNISVTYDEAIALYKTFLEFIKSPHIDIFQIQTTPESQRTPPPHIQIDRRAVPLSSFTKEEEATIINVYLQQKNIRRVSGRMKEQRGPSDKWSSHSIQQLLKYIIKKALKKVIITRDRRMPNITPANFHQTETFVNKIFHEAELTSLKEYLLKFCKVNKVKSHEVNNLIIMANNAYLKVNQLNQDNQDDISVIPKVQFDQSVHQPIPQANNNARLTVKKEAKAEQPYDDDRETQPDEDNVDVKEQVTYEQGFFKEVIQIQ